MPILNPYSPSPQGILNSLFPTELVAKIWFFMTIVDLVRYGKTSKTNYIDVRNALRSSILRLLGRFSTDPVRLLATMRNEHAVISGSVALHAMHAVNFSGNLTIEQGWYPNDIDVYVPQSSNPETAHPMVTYMTEVEGYAIRMEEVKHPNVYTLYPEVEEVIYLVKDGTRLDVIISASRFAMAPIFRFHSSIVMNCITGCGLFSAYPEMTGNKRGILNPMVFRMDPLAPHMPPLNVRRAFQKYATRGFDIRRNPSCWMGNRHRCKIDMDCPHASRRVGDWGCLYSKFTPDGGDTIGTSSSIGEDMLGDRSEIAWHLGGDACNGLKKELSGYMHCRKISRIRSLVG